MKYYKLILLFFFTFMIQGRGQNKQSVAIEYLYSDVAVDEWKEPGLYSPVNMFDGDINTCFADGFNKKRNKNAGVGVELFFYKPVKIDEIKIMNGFAKNDELYVKNNRIRNFGVFFKSSKKTDDEGSSENFILNDTKKFQNLKLKKEYFVDNLSFGSNCRNSPCDNLYRGSKYNDTCITEIEFYYKGQKIEIQNVNKLKEDYVKRIQRNLTTAFSNRIYFVTFDDNIDSISRDIPFPIMKTYKDGNIKYEDTAHNKYYKGNVGNYLPDMWKVENSKLYMRFKGDWILYKYYLYIDDFFVRKVIINTIPSKDLPETGEFRLQYDDMIK